MLGIFHGSLHEMRLIIQTNKSLIILGMPHFHSPYRAHSCGSTLHSMTKSKKSMA